MAKKHQDVIGLFSALPRRRPLYRGIAGVVERAVVQGTLAPSHRLPPERVLARALRVSRTTVAGGCAANMASSAMALRRP